MGVYRTAIVQGLSIAHGRGERRQFCPGIPEVISKTLEDKKTSNERETRDRGLPTVEKEIAQQRREIAYALRFDPSHPTRYIPQRCAYLELTLALLSL